jgi:Tfp pilus assembly protein PilV
MTKPKHIQGWTMTETLVMMIVAGVVFLAVMDGLVLFNRYTQQKTALIIANMKLYEGYYHLRYLTATADSIAVGNGYVRLYRGDNVFTDLVEIDSMLIARTGTMGDTLMQRISDLRISVNRSETDSLCLTITATTGNRLYISFPIKFSEEEQIIESLREQENLYRYEEL